jgi:hypothetical protein
MPRFLLAALLQKDGFGHLGSNNVRFIVTRLIDATLV